MVVRMQSLNSKTREGSFKAAGTQALDKVQPSLFAWKKQQLHNEGHAK